MAEYYNCTSSALPVDLGNGASVRARAMSKFLVPPELESAPELTRLVAAGRVKRLDSPPWVDSSALEPPEPKVESVVTESSVDAAQPRRRRQKHMGSDNVEE